MKNKESFAKFILAIGEMFDKDISPILKDIYWKALEQFTDKQCMRAFNEVILSSRFFPKPVDIIEAIRGTQGNRATVAWTKTLDAVRRVGNYQSVQFDDPVIHSVIEVMGGWIQLGMMLIDDEKWKQKEFEKLYPVMEVRGNHPEQLVGIVERDNSANGHLDHIPKVVQIGKFKEIKQITKLS